MQDKKNIYLSLGLVVLVIIFVVFMKAPNSKQGNNNVGGDDLTAAAAEKCFAPARAEHASLVFNNKIWVLGGTSTGGLLNDVWSSTTGTANHWSKVTAPIPWSARTQFGATVYGGKMWIAGGLAANAGYKNDVWSSNDGITWTQATSAAAWTPRSNLALVTFNNKMWVIGGVDGVSITPANQVWWSNDGVTWNPAPNLPANMYYIKNKSDVMVLGNTMVARPSDTSNFWSTTDGTTWTQIATNTPIVARTGTTSTVFNNVGWILGGMNSFNLSLMNDVWSSNPAGNVWNQGVITSGGPNSMWAPRYGQSAVTFNGKIWVLGGSGSMNNSNTLFKDAWSSADGSTWTRSCP